LQSYAGSENSVFYISFWNQTNFPIKISYAGYENCWDASVLTDHGPILIPAKKAASAQSYYETQLYISGDPFSHCKYTKHSLEHELAMSFEALNNGATTWPGVFELFSRIDSYGNGHNMLGVSKSAGVIVPVLKGHSIEGPYGKIFYYTVVFQSSGELDASKPAPTLTGIDLTPSWPKESTPVYKLTVTSADISWPVSPPMTEQQEVAIFPYIIRGETCDSTGNNCKWHTIGYLSRGNPFTYDQSHHFSLKNKENFYFRDTDIYTAIDVGQGTLTGQWSYSKPLALRHSVDYKGKNFGTDIPAYYSAECSGINPYRNSKLIADSVVNLNFTNNFIDNDETTATMETNGINQIPLYTQIKLEDSNGNDIPYTTNQATYSCLYNDIYFINSAGKLITGYYKTLAGDTSQVVTSEKGAYVVKDKNDLTNKDSDSNPSSKEFYFSSNQPNSEIHACVADAPYNDDYNNQYGHIDCGTGHALQIHTKNITPQLFYIKLALPNSSSKDNSPSFFQEGNLSASSSNSKDFIYQRQPNQYAPYYVPYYYHYTNADNQPETDKIWLLAGLKDYNAITDRYLDQDKDYNATLFNSLLQINLVDNNELQPSADNSQPFRLAFFKAITPTGDMISQYVINGK
jgi:hypothetical protein